MAVVRSWWPHPEPDRPASVAQYRPLVGGQLIPAEVLSGPEQLRPAVVSRPDPHFRLPFYPLDGRTRRTRTPSPPGRHRVPTIVDGGLDRRADDGYPPTSRIPAPGIG